MKIGEKLKEGRLLKKLTQEEVSKILHVSRSTVSSWEVNRTYPDLDLLVMLSDLYEISLDIMLREDTKMIQKLVKENKNSKRRKSWIIILLAIFIPSTLFLGYKLWQSGLDVSHNQIQNVRIELNGEKLNPESELILNVEFGKFHEYSGYFIDSEEKVITVTLQQTWGISDNSQEEIRLPLRILNSIEQEIEEIEFMGPFRSKKNIYNFKK